MQRVPVTLVVALLVVSGVAPALAVGAYGESAPSPAASATPATADARPLTAGAGATAPPDPAQDRLGWENGYWHNESIDVNQSDGVSDAELDAIVSRTMARVEVIRELEFDERVPVEIISREEFRSQGATGSNQTNESFRTFENAKFEAMFLIGEDRDSLEVEGQNRGSSVLGYYSPSKDAIVLIANNESTPKLDEYTLAHELVHAVQDQQFDLASISSQTRDGYNANNGLIEGDANYVQHLYEQRCRNPDDAWNGTCVQPPASEGGSGGTPPNMGVYFLNYQPYSDGPKFVASLRQNGGWAAVNDAYANTPQSAEQVIHPEKYPNDAPTEVRLEDELGEGWERVRPPNRPDYATVGQAGVASMFVYPLYHGGQGGRIVEPTNWLNYTSGNRLSSVDPLNYGFGYAEGWDGDRMHFYRNADGEVGYVWRLVWDSEADATEFRDGYRQLLSYWGGKQVGPNTYRIEDGQGGFADAFHVSVEGDTVTIVNAPSVAALSEVRTSVDAQTNSTGTTTTETGGTDGEDGATSDDASTRTDEATGDSPTTDATGAATPGFAVVTAVLAFLAAAFILGRR